MQVRDAMIVAGGRGTRLAPLTDTCPKPMLALVGVPFLAGQVRRLAAAGVTRVSLVVGADTTPFQPLVDMMRPHGVTVALVPEPAPLDTAGGVRSVIDRAVGPVVVCNGDILTDVDLSAMVAAHHASQAAATLSLIRVDDPSTFGVCVREGTAIVDFVEKPAPGTLPGQDTVNAGTYVIEPEALLAFPPGPLSFERAVFPGILEAGGHLEGVVWDGVWADLGTPARWLAGQRLVLDGQMAWPMPAGLTAPAGGVAVHPGATVAPDARLTGSVVVCRGADVGAGAQLGPNVVVGHDARVGARASVAHAALFERATVGADTTMTRALLGPAAAVGRHHGPVDDVVLGAGVVVGDGDRLIDGARLGR